MADWQRTKHEAAITEGPDPKILKFGFKDFVVDYGRKKILAVCKHF